MKWLTKKNFCLVIAIIGFILPVITHLSLWTFGFLAGLGYAGWMCLPDDNKKKGTISMNKLRCEHNCHLCKREWLGRCHGIKHYGKDISVEGTDIPVCEEYEYGGTDIHLKEIECATNLGVRYLYIDLDNDMIDKEE